MYLVLCSVTYFVKILLNKFMIIDPQKVNYTMKQTFKMKRS